MAIVLNEHDIRTALISAEIAFSNFGDQVSDDQLKKYRLDWYASYILGRLGGTLTLEFLEQCLRTDLGDNNWIDSVTDQIAKEIGCECSDPSTDSSEEGVHVQLTGFERLHDSSLNQSTAFSHEDRQRFGLRGLLPAHISTQEKQMERVLENLRRKGYDIERYIFLLALQGRNERLFYRILIEHIDEIMPYVYTPTVGQACREYAHIFRQPRGFYITLEDRGEIRQILNNWPESDVSVIVVTDGERILGLGDLGANGIGIPIGKLALYTACAGIPPGKCLPIQIDVGTNNQTLLDDPLYLGVPSKRVSGKAYDELMDEFVIAVQDAYPKALIQFEDFLTPNAYRLLERYRDRAFCFNDDIQGTASVALAGVYGATRLTQQDFNELRVMFLGAGSAATGIADLMTQAFIQAGLTEDDARQRLWFVDINGLVVKSRHDLLPHNLPYSHDHEALNFIEAIKTIKPHVLIGATGHAGAFTREVIELMTVLNKQPVIFALSNPSSHAECTSEQAYEWSRGKAIFASGSPFPPLDLGGGKTWRPGQGNNVYVFPGIGLGVVGVEATRVTERMFLAAARALADQVKEEDLNAGAVYPPLRDIREVSLAIAVAVAEVAYDEGFARLARPSSLHGYLTGLMYDPKY